MQIIDDTREDRAGHEGEQAKSTQHLNDVVAHSGIFYPYACHVHGLIECRHGGHVGTRWTEPRVVAVNAQPRDAACVSHFCGKPAQTLSVLVFILILVPLAVACPVKV